MDLKRITDDNRKAWNEATTKHQQGRTIDYKAEFAKPGYSTLDDILTAKLNQIGLAGKNVAQICCNNGRELLSLLNLGAHSGTGFDISDAAIAEAKEYAAVAGTAAEFVRTDAYDIGSEYHNRFDLVLFTIGGLCWLPDLPPIFEIVAAILKPGGDLVIYDMHPIIYVFATDEDPEWDPAEPSRPALTYFRTEPWLSTTGIDYVGQTKYESAPSRSYTQTLSNTINPIIAKGMEIKELQEYGHDISGLYEHLERLDILPLSYLLHATKKA